MVLPITSVLVLGVKDPVRAEVVDLVDPVAGLDLVQEVEMAKVALVDMDVQTLQFRLVILRFQVV